MAWPLIYSSAALFIIVAAIIHLHVRVNKLPRHLPCGCYPPCECTVSSDTGVRLRIAPAISDDSWLCRDEYKTFRSAYDYAAQKTRAIEPLSKVTPEDAYWIHRIIQHGFDSHNLPEPGKADQ